MRGILFLLVFSACEAPGGMPPVDAFDPTELVDGAFYRWPSGSVVKVWVSPDGRDDHALERSTDLAIRNWNTVPRFAEFRLERTDDMMEANVVVYERTAGNPLIPEGCGYEPRGSGSTWFCLQGNRAAPIRATDGRLTQATVLISTQRGAVLSQELYDAVVAHEFGHALGLGGHSLDRDDVMYGNPTVSTLSARDRSTLQFVLGQPPTALLR